MKLDVKLHRIYCKVNTKQKGPTNQYARGVGRAVGKGQLGGS